MKKITLLIIILGIITLSTAQIEKKELKITPEMEEKMVALIKGYPKRYFSEHGITDTQLENLHTGKPIPNYWIVSKKLEYVDASNASYLSDDEHVLVRFMDTWNVPVLFEGKPLFFAVMGFSNCGNDSSRPSLVQLINEIKNTIEQIHNYEYKNSIVGAIAVNYSKQGIDHLIVRKGDQDMFVQIYDEATDEYFKNEYTLSELINHLKELSLHEREARTRYYERYYAQVADKSELELTTEITEMLINQAYSSFINDPEWHLLGFGITDRSQLEHLHLGKPIPEYRIENENLTFIGKWEVLVLSDGEPLFLTAVKLEEDGEYRWAGCGSAQFAKIIHNYEYRDLIIGFLGLRHESDFLMIRRDNKDICVQTYDYDTREYFKNEYSLSEILFARAQVGKKELILTPELEERVIGKIKSLPEENYSEYGITDRSQLENLHVGKPTPRYLIVNKKSEPIYSSFNMSHLYEDEPLSLEFTKNWNVSVMSDEAPLSFGVTVFLDAGSPFVCYINNEMKNTLEHFNNYEPKDSIKGFVSLTPYQHGIDYLMIRKNNQDVFVKVYDKITGEYFKNEYSFSELTNHLKEARMNYYAQVANKSELIITPEITKMLDNTLLTRLRNCSDETLSDCGIKDRSQLENFYLGKPTPIYTIVNENLTFTGFWNVPVMSDGEPFYLPYIKLVDDEQYIHAGDGYNPLAKIIHNYEHKDLIIGELKVRYGWGYLIIRKDNQDIFVQIYDNTTREYLKNEYSFSEVLNLLKK